MSYVYEETDYLLFEDKIRDEFASVVTEAGIIYAGMPEPAGTDQWLELVPFFNGTTNYAVGSLGVERGIFRVIVTSKLGWGINSAEKLANQIIAAFPKGSKFGSAVTDEMPSKSGLIQETDRVMIPVDIRWRATRT